jgi:hypothetical protein
MLRQAQHERPDHAVGALTVRLEPVSKGERQFDTSLLPTRPPP